MAQQSKKKFGIERLKALGATEFIGTIKPKEAEKWIRTLEKCFRVMQGRVDWHDFKEIFNNAALQVEKSLNIKRPSSELSREEERETIRNPKKSKTMISQGSRWDDDQKQKCNDSGRRHARICRRKSITCHQYGEKGHYKSEYQSKFGEDEER
ncbi:hypothetical protein E5676_scaffold120G002250 [Cucumis melo var. makuwa]|uniref:Uncharacterized protein n=1 Tax=Cucumis melo var. makuwa TaxID=1194695 RepID=A0A5D3DZA3_CUCMM|nr:hypothetical protein E6C27_scaffold186G001860 [Cucumis melo var. makuwa]TYK29093.1 hypothetical protein E5676_scaffold120G002250 [Cucumis melo var. makuwa]